MAKQRNITVVYKVNTQEVVSAKAQVEEAKKATDKLVESTNKYETASSGAYKKTGVSIQDLNTKLNFLKQQIIETDLRDSKRLDKLISQYKLLSADVKAYNDLLNNSNKEASGFNKQLSGIVGFVRGGIMLQLIKETATAMANFAIMEGKVVGVKNAFDRLPGATKILNDMRLATQGMLTDYNLMQRALQAKNFKIPLEEFATLLEFATTRAQQTGQEVDYLVDSIVRGIGMQSVLRLDNLGISAARLREQFKGVSIRSLEVSEVTKGVTEVIRQEMADQGKYVKTSETSVGNLKRAWEELWLVVNSRTSGTTSVVSDFFADTFDYIRDLIKGSKAVNAEMAKTEGATKAQAFAQQERNKNNLEAYDKELKLADQAAAKQKLKIMILKEELKALGGLNPEYEDQRELINEQIKVFNMRNIATNEYIKILQGQRRQIVITKDEEAAQFQTYEKLEQQLQDLNEQFEKETAVNDKTSLALTGAKILATKKLIEELDKLRTAQDPKKSKEMEDPEAAMMENFTIKNEIFLKQLEDFEKGMLDATKKTDEEYKKWYDAWLAAQVKSSTDASDQETKDLEKKARIKKKFIEELRDYSIAAARDVLTAILMTREVDSSDLEARYARELEAVGNNEGAKRQIEKRMEADRARAEEKNKQIRKNNALKSIAIDTAVNIVRSVVENGGIPAGLPFGALAAVMGLAQAATVRKFKDGVIDLDGPGTTTSDSIPARLSKHESVMTAKETASSKGLLQAIRARKLNDKIFEKIAVESPSVVVDTSSIAKAVSRNKAPDLVRQGGFIYEMKESGKNTKRLIRSKSFSM